LKKNQFFGEIGFFADIQRTASVETIDFVNLLVVKRSDFIKISSFHNNDMEMIHKIKHNIEVE
jgi:CRP-like cAMP-binding protein